MGTTRRAVLIALSCALLLPGCGRSGGGRPTKFTRSELAELARAARERRREELEKITIRLGAGIALGNLRISPKKVELRNISAADRWGNKLETKQPVLVLTCEVQNVAVDEKQAFEPRARATGEDDIGHKLAGLGDRFRKFTIEGDQQREELAPGGRATILICLRPASEEATAYRWHIETQVRDAPVDAWEKWCLVFDADQIERP